MHADVCKVILDARPKKIVYVSCNPATQARDVELMKDYYDVVAVQPVDMFPHTHHVECVGFVGIEKGYEKLDEKFLIKIYWYPVKIKFSKKGGFTKNQGEFWAY